MLTHYSGINTCAMQKTISIRVLPSEAEDANALKTLVASAFAVQSNQITGFNIVKKSIDARSKQPWINLQLNVFINEPFKEVEVQPLQLKEVSHASRSVIVIGAGPAGLFAAIRLIEAGIRPIIIERGKDVRTRRRDLAAINKEGIMNSESNYCFGEGGAGTYSDGKLYTRSTKRGDVQKVLQILVESGADKNILYEAHPHIGTNKLPAIITNMREKIIACGGLVLFSTRVDDLILDKNIITGIKTNAGDIIKADAVILATGHSARDIFELLNNKKIRIESKSFALGVRVEHPQSLIDNIQYHCYNRDPYLPPASYSVVEQVNGKGVFSFCMCPGGIIAPAATGPNEIVVNGWSPSKRNNPYANSGIVVSVGEKDFQPYQNKGVLAGLYYQKSVEEKAYFAGGGLLKAPAQRLVDFAKNISSSSLPDCSYLPGIESCSLKDVLPESIYQSLCTAFHRIW